jgi:hypothetical protein
VLHFDIATSRAVTGSAHASWLVMMARNADLGVADR